MKRGVFLAIGAAALLIGALLAWNEIRQEREFRRLIADGDRALAEGQTVVAVEAFSGALTFKPDSMLAYLKRGDSYRRRGELAAALRDLRTATELDPDAPRPAELLGDVNLGMGRYERAAALFRRVVLLDDRAPGVLYKLGLALYRSGRVADAIEPLRRAIAIDAGMAEAHYLLGVCLRAGQRTADAVRSLQQAIALNPASPAAREELADIYRSLGRPRDRIEQLEALAALEPARAERLVSVAVAYAAAGRVDAAVTTLGRAAERYPDEPAVYTTLGRVWLETAETRADKVSLAKAIGALQPAAARASASSETLALYGRALYLSGDFNAAELALQQAVTRTPVEPIAFRYLAQTAGRLRHAELARTAMTRYHALVENASPLP